MKLVGLQLEGARASTGLSLLCVHRRTAQHPFGGQTEFCSNGERKLFVKWPRQGEKKILNYCRAYF